MRYLVTGGAGFIGSHLCEALLALGHEVRVLDDFSSGSRDNLATVMGRVEIIEGRVEDFDAMRVSAESADIVVHLAAISSVERSVMDPVENHRVNVLGTLSALEAARAAGARRFVFASSAAVYGDGEEMPKVEALEPRPVSPYALAKVVGEHYCRLYVRHYGLPAVALRFFNVFGPRQDPSSPYSGVISIFIDCVKRNIEPRVFGDGEQSRDFVYVSDVIGAMISAATLERAVGQVLNVGRGERRSVNELWASLRRLAGGGLAPVYEPPRGGDVRHSQADITRARDVLGYEPSVTFEEGLRRTLLHRGS